jgi:hypothetical protein
MTYFSIFARIRELDMSVCGLKNMPVHLPLMRTQINDLFFYGGFAIITVYYNNGFNLKYSKQDRFFL